MSDQLHATVIVDESRQVQAGAIIYALFGMSVDDLAKEIRDNLDGTYDGIVADTAQAVV